MWEVCAFLMMLPQRGSRSQSLYHGGLELCGSQCCLWGGPDLLNCGRGAAWTAGVPALDISAKFAFTVEIIKEDWDNIIQVFFSLLLLVLVLLFLYISCSATSTFFFFLTCRENTAGTPPIPLLSARRRCLPHFWEHCEEELRAPSLNNGNGAVLSQAGPLGFTSLQQWHGQSVTGRGCSERLWSLLETSKSCWDMVLSKLL